MPSNLSKDFTRNVAEARRLIHETAGWQRLHNEAIESSRQLLRESWSLLADLQRDGPALNRASQTAGAEPSRAGVGARVRPLWVESSPTSSPGSRPQKQRVDRA